MLGCSTVLHDRQTAFLAQPLERLSMVCIMFLVLLVNLLSYVMHGRIAGARSSPGLKQSGELRLCWSWWIWGGLHELKTHLPLHPFASQALSTSTAMANSHALSPWPPSLCPSLPQPMAPLGAPWHCLHPSSPLWAASALHLRKHLPLHAELLSWELPAGAFQSLLGQLACVHRWRRWADNKECKPMLRDDQGYLTKYPF